MLITDLKTVYTLEVDPKKRKPCRIQKLDAPIMQNRPICRNIARNLPSIWKTPHVFHIGAGANPENTIYFDLDS